MVAWTFYQNVLRASKANDRIKMRYIIIYLKGLGQQEEDSEEDSADKD